MNDNQQVAQQVMVQFSEQEYFSFAAEIMKPLRRRRFMQCSAVMALGVASGLVAHAVAQILSKTTALSASFYLPVFVLLFLPLYLGSLRLFRAYFLRGHFNNRGNFLRRMQFSLQPSALIIASDISHTQMSWRGILKIVSTKDLILFYVDNMQAHIAPKRCFASPEAAEAFYQQALTYWQAAQAAPQPETAP